MDLYSAALKYCTGALNNVQHAVKDKNSKQYHSNNETVKQLGSKKCSLEQDSLKWWFEFVGLNSQVQITLS